MAKVIVKGVTGFDGEYEIVEPPYTKREWHEIKVQTGLRPAELEDAFQQSDPDVILAFTAITLIRAGHQSRAVWEMLWDTDDDDARITFVADPEENTEDDALPPAPTAENAPDSNVSGVENDDVSGVNTNPHAVPSGLLPYLVSTGTQG